MRILLVLCLAAVALYGLGLGALALVQRRLIYPGAYDPPPRPAAPPAGTQILTVATADGESLRALWKPPREGCDVVLTFHGNGSRPEPHAARFADGPWREGGWGVLAIAYRGYPGSTGSPSEAGLIEDGLAAARVVAQRAPSARILLHGHSLGTAVAIAVSRQVPHLGLYLEAPFDSMLHAAQLHMPYALPGLFLLDTYRSDRRIAGGTSPVLIVHGAGDEIVPPKLAVRLTEATGSRARVEVIPGDHVSIFGSRDVEAIRWFGTPGPRACGAEPQAASP